jgi:hypothetical protein
MNKTDNALQRFIDRTKNYVDIEREVSLLREKNVSVPIYINLFRVNRGSQTEIQNIPNVKTLLLQLNLLSLDIQVVKEECERMKTKMSEEVCHGMEIFVQNELQKINSRVGWLQNRIYLAHRTKLGNQIAIITQNCRKELNGRIRTLKDEHQLQVHQLRGKIKETKSSCLKLESQIKKYRAYVEKCTQIARRAGIDVSHHLNDSSDNLEQLQSLVRSKRESLEILKGKVETSQKKETSSQRPTNHLKRLVIPKPNNTHEKAIKESASVTVASPSTKFDLFCQFNLVSVSDGSDTQVALKFQFPMTERQSHQFERAVQMRMQKLEREFEQQLVEEERKTLEMVDSFVSQYDALKNETRLVLQEQKSIQYPKIFDVISTNAVNY